jgi:TonB family protein
MSIKLLWCVVMFVGICSVAARSPIESVPVQRDPVAVSSIGDDDQDTPLVILSKPRPAYTEEARRNGVQGNVILRITFEADGTIGAIEVVKGLEQGLTEATEEAARKIEFRPARKNGKPIAVTKQLEYQFSVY